MQAEMCLYRLDLNDFLTVLDNCKGKVFLNTDDGDSVSIRSRLFLLSTLGKAINGQIEKISVRCELPEDETKLFRYALYREKPQSKE